MSLLNLIFGRPKPRRRKLKTCEHKDNIRLNNRYENLRVMPRRSIRGCIGGRGEVYVDKKNNNKKLQKI